MRFAFRIRSSVLASLIVAGCLVAPGAPAFGVIKAPMEKLDTASAVVVGTITAVDPARKVIEVKTVDVTRGDPIGPAFKLLVDKPADLVGQAGTGGTVVIIAGKAAFHIVSIADRWVLAKRKADAASPVWVVTSPWDETNRMFPGRSAAIARAVLEMKSGKMTLLSVVDNKVFQGGVKDLGKLDVTKPASLAAADVNADKKPDLLVTSAGGAKLFLAGASGYEDATAKLGLSGAAGQRAAFGDVNADGKPDLLLGNTLWLNDGQKFTAEKAPLALPARAQVLAAALADATGDGKPDALVLLATGEVLAFENPGAAGQPWKPQPPRKLPWDGPAPSAAFFGDFGDTGKPHVIVVRETGVTRHALDDAGGPAADYARLTGEKLDSHHSALAAGFKNAAAAVLDINGDRRPDLFVNADGGSALLVNRGFGAFLVNPDAAAVLAKAPPQLKLAPSAVTASADVAGDGFDDLLVLTEAGQLFLLDNPPLPAHP